MYKITYEYTTSSTFDPTTTETGSFSHTWTNLDKAKLALARMKEHYKWQASISSSWGEDKPKPKWHRPKPGAERYSWYFNVEDDDGAPIWLDGSQYLGYFEHLVSAEITKAKEEAGLSFTI